MKCYTPNCQGVKIFNATTKEWKCNQCGAVWKGQEKTLKEMAQTDPFAKAQERKEVFINKSLDKKNTAIEIAGAKRDACMIVTSMMSQSPVQWTEDEIMQKLEGWARYWINFDPSEAPEEKINLNNAKF